MQVNNFQKSPTIMEIIEQNRMNTRLLFLETLTGLTNLSYAFNDQDIRNDNLNEIEILVMYYSNNRIHKDLYKEPIEFLIETIGFKEKCLSMYGLLNPLIYDNLDYHEILEVAFTKILTYPGNSSYIINSDNFGFPSENNFVSGTENTIQQLPGVRSAMTWISFLLNSSFNLVNLMNLLNSRKNTDSTLFFHGCQWKHARSIQRQVKIISQDSPSDFGFDNFYVSDSLISSMNWSLRGNCPAVVVFSIPNSFISRYNRLSLNDFTFENYIHWKKFVFNVRKDDEYAYQIDDELEIITGPILKNPSKIKKYEDCKKLIFNDITIYQTTFKTTDICKELNKYLLTTIYLPNCSF